MMRAEANVERQATELSLDIKLIAQARDLDIDISQVAETGIARAVAKEQARLWKAENRAAIESMNAYVEENGLPLAAFRPF